MEKWSVNIINKASSKYPFIDLIIKKIRMQFNHKTCTTV